MEKLKKMIEILAGFAKAGRDTEQTRRLARNLQEIEWALRAKKITEADIASVIAKQSLQSAIANSIALLAKIEKLAMEKDLATKPVSLVAEIEATRWQEDI